MTVTAELTRVDYEDDWVAGTLEATPEDALSWARDVLEGAPREFVALLRLGWRLLGFDFSAPAGTTRILGWPVVEQTPDRVVLAARTTRFGLDMRLVATTGPRRGAMGTRVRFDSRLGRVTWRLARRTHRSMLRRMTGDAGHRRR